MNVFFLGVFFTDRMRKKIKKDFIDEMLNENDLQKNGLSCPFLQETRFSAPDGA
jgi:hypothetical protein